MKCNSSLMSNNTRAVGIMAPQQWGVSNKSVLRRRPIVSEVVRTSRLSTLPQPSTLRYKGILHLAGTFKLNSCFAARVLVTGIRQRIATRMGLPESGTQFQGRFWVRELAPRLPSHLLRTRIPILASVHTISRARQALELLGLRSNQTTLATIGVVTLGARAASASVIRAFQSRNIFSSHHFVVCLRLKNTFSQTQDRQ